MKVIRNVDKKSSEYILGVEVEKGTRNKSYLEKEIGGITVTTEEYSELVLHMADGSKPRYANIEENKVRLLQLMTEQHLRNKMCEEELTDKYCKNIAMSVACGIGGLIFVVMAGIVPNQDYLLFDIAFRIGFPTIVLAYGSIKGIIAKKIYNKLKEIEKNDYLLENEEVLNEADLENENILENIKDKDKVVIAEIKQAKDKENDKNYFDIISIDGLSLDALKKIKTNIERENYLGLGRTDEETKGNAMSKGKPYVKK